MSMATRIRERREALGMSRQELADKIGVTLSAIGNYELGISAPKVELLYKIFDALQCDANYLYQDEMRSIESNTLTSPEHELVSAYRSLTLENKAKAMRVVKALRDSQEADEILDEFANSKGALA